MRRHRTWSSTRNECSEHGIGSSDASIEEPSQEASEYVFPTADKAPYHVANVGVIVVHHRVLKGLEEVLLKLEMWQLLLLQETHCELS
jgi:hypothetical protein